MPDNLPKSLHTVRVLVIMAMRDDLAVTAEEAVENAAEALGYAGTPDAYGLKAKAVAQLNRAVEDMVADRKAA